MGLRILIVDDALFMRNMLRDIFISAGFEVVRITSYNVCYTKLLRMEVDRTGETFPATRDIKELGSLDDLLNPSDFQPVEMSTESKGQNLLEDPLAHSSVPSYNFV